MTVWKHFLLLSFDHRSFRINQPASIKLFKSNLYNTNNNAHTQTLALSFTKGIPIYSTKQTKNCKTFTIPTSLNWNT